MKKISILRIATAGLCFLLVSIFYGCFNSIEGSGPIITKSRDVGQFTNLTLDIPAKVTLVISDSAGCVIVAQQNIIDNIETKRNGDNLRIKSKNNFRCDKQVEITISTSLLEAVNINGSGDVQGMNPVKGNDLKLSINGSGNITLNASVADLVSKINGSGDIFVSGKAGHHQVEINGSGNLKAYDLITDICKVNINGSGDAEINVNSNLDARLIGSGNITYKGTPTIKSEITGSGSLSKKN